MHQFQVSDRVRLSKLGEERSPRMETKVGTIVSLKKRHKSGSGGVLVLFDDRKKPTRLHWSYVEPIEENSQFRNNPQC
jgi:hypothetical protein